MGEQHATAAEDTLAREQAIIEDILMGERHATTVEDTWMGEQ